MNIIIGLAVISAALYLRFKYRPEGSLAAHLFRCSIVAGAVSVITIECYATVWMMLWPAADIVISGLLLRCYYTEIRKQLSARAARAAEVRREALMAEKQKYEMARRRSRASVYAFCESESAAA